MSKQTKEQKPATVELFTRNQNTYFSEIERLVLDGYTIVLDGFLAPTNIGGILTANLVLKRVE